jgi:hypothetical protein
MAAVQQKLKGTLQGITPESLRDDDSLRQHIQKEAAQALRDTQKAIDDLPSIW